MSIEKYIYENYKTRPKKNPPPTVDFDGVWRNGLGSEMDLKVSSSGIIEGVYRTGVGQPDPAEEFPLVGFASNDILGFTVNFGKYGSMTSWVGQHTVDEEGNARIYTMWHLAKDIEDEAERDNLWSAVLAGANYFFR